MVTDRRVVLYIAMSLDGYIAKPGDDLSFLALVQREGQDYGYLDFMKTVDTVILGRRTYDWIMTQVPVFPHADKETFVITRTPKAAVGNVVFHTDKLSSLIAGLKSRAGRTIFIDGGSQIVNELLKEKLIDEYYISIIPVLLGCGIRLFNEGWPEQRLQLVSSKSYETGLTQLHYLSASD